VEKRGQFETTLILGLIAILAAASCEINTGLKAPDSITVNGKSYSLEEGNIFLFFFDPECLYCRDAAERMSKLNWKDTKVVAIPTRVPEASSWFLSLSGLKADVSTDSALLRKTFKFIDPPYGVALHFGRQRAVIDKFDPAEPAKTLRQIGFVQ
jgi:hypothetical protein